MKITLENFGPIKHFEFDTEDDFTLIFGKNNTGKSYAISAIYLVLKNIANVNHYNLLNPLSNFSQELREILLDSQEKDDIKKEIEHLLKDTISAFLEKNINNSFLNTFGSIENLENVFSNKHLSIKLETEFFKVEIRIYDKKMRIKNIEICREKITSAQYKEKKHPTDNGREIYFYIPENANDRIIFDDDGSRAFIFEKIGELTNEISQYIKGFYYLPASRSGLYQALSSFGQIVASLSLMRMYTNQKIELPSISEPVSDYFLGLSNIDNSKQKEKNKISDITSKIEDEILNGKVEFDKETKKIIFRPNNTSLSLDLSYCSSMVSEISPIVSYLRDVVNSPENYGDRNILDPHEDMISYLTEMHIRGKYTNLVKKSLVFIEEPEAHLHPEIQVKLLEQFAELAKNDVKFVITTHSNYMFNKFNNLVISGDIDPEKSKALLFKETPEGSESITMPIDEFGVDDQNFVKTAENLYNEKLDLIEKIGQE